MFESRWSLEGYLCKNLLTPQLFYSHDSLFRARRKGGKRNNNISYSCFLVVEGTHARLYFSCFTLEGRKMGRPNRGERTLQVYTLKSRTILYIRISLTVAK